MYYTPDSLPIDLAHGISSPSSENKKSCSLPQSSVLGRLLSEKVPQIKYPTSEHKSSGRVLTSSENLLRLEEKKRRKQRKKEESEEVFESTDGEGKKGLRKRA